MNSTSPTHTPGRPRSEQARRAVLNATRVLFEEGGYAATTIEAIAARSGVAKTTIYRWWPNRPCLVVDLLLEIAATAVPPPAGPDPIRALRIELHRVARAAEALPGRLLLSLLGEAQQDPEVRDALLKGLFNPRRRASAAMIRRAQASGALRQEVPPSVAVDMLFGPLFYRMMVRQERIPDGYVRQIFQTALTGLSRRGR